MLLSEFLKDLPNIKDASNTITVECNNIKCKHKWDIDPDLYHISGNRITAGPPITCPKCNRIDRPYITRHGLNK